MSRKPAQDGPAEVFYLAEVEGMAYASICGSHGGHQVLLLSIEGAAAFPVALPEGFRQASGLRIGGTVRVSIKPVEDAEEFDE